MSIKDGGPAFPIFPPVDRDHIVEGMSLRDYFAAKAMEGFCSTIEGIIEPNWGMMANCSYKMADAMLKAREEG